MVCQHCKKNTATINYFEEIGGDRFEINLCASCYADLYGALSSKVNGDFWAGLFSDGVRQVKTCPVCGLSYDEYERTGLLGCTSCYDVFKEQLIPSIARIHGKVAHVGKATSNRDEFGLYRELDGLKKQLEIALRERRYSDASKLNQKINAINKQLFGSDGNG